jgi:DNA adenine methylase
LKWVGGKRQLLPQLRRFYPEFTGRYFEPFVGSGAVFFDLLGRGALDGRGVTLSDDNADLVGCYLRVGDSLGAVVGKLDALAVAHAARGRACYLEVRDERFNPQRAAWRAAGADVARYPAELAAMLIYLNRTGYNGLFRVNRSGAFNVPPGRYARPRIADHALLRGVSATLNRTGVQVALAPFETVIERAAPGDFVYFDPPYAPLTATANFHSYTARGFGEGDQARLQEVMLTLAASGAHVLLSNSTAPLVVDLFERAEARAAGLQVHRVPARRAINTKADRRGVIDELLVTTAAEVRGER